MKEIKLLQGDVLVQTKEGEKTVKVDTLQLISTAVNSAPPGGFDVSGMIDRLAVQTKVKKMTEVIEASEVGWNMDYSLELEDAEYKNLAGWVATVKWAFLSQFIVDFAQQFKV